MGRLSARLLVVAHCSVVAACASSAQEGAARLHGTAAIDDARRDREHLARLTEHLGGPLPSPALDDDVGVEAPEHDVTRVFASASPRLGGRSTRARLTAWRGRVHTVELTFPERCDAACARSLVATVEGWVGPLSTHQEGRARFLAAEVDTVHVMLEVYPSRPDLTRVVLRCAPLWNAAQGRPAHLPDVGERFDYDEPARCRPLAR